MSFIAQLASLQFLLKHDGLRIEGAQLVIPGGREEGALLSLLIPGTEKAAETGLGEQGSFSMHT